jgi:hypothetical protein
MYFCFSNKTSKIIVCDRCINRMKRNSEVYPPNIHATTLPLKKAFAIKKTKVYSFLLSVFRRVSKNKAISIYIREYYNADLFFRINLFKRKTNIIELVKFYLLEYDRRKNILGVSVFFGFLTNLEDLSLLLFHITIKKIIYLSKNLLNFFILLRNKIITACHIQYLRSNIYLITFY